MFFVRFRPGPWGTCLRALLKKKLSRRWRWSTIIIGAFRPTLHNGYSIPSRARELSQRELEVLTLVAMGLTNKDIAERLFISDKTARNHVVSCLEKLRAKDRTEAATTAIRRGLIRVTE